MEVPDLMSEAELIRHTITAFALGFILGVGIVPNLLDAIAKLSEFADERESGDDE